MRIGILSLAHHHAEAYIAAIRATPGLELMGLWDGNEARGRAAAADAATRFFASPSALLAAKPEAVIVASENSKHRDLVEAAAAAGAHVLCEKPLATTVADAESMVAACRAAGVRLMTAFPMRFSPALLEVKGRLDSGELGRPYCFTASNQGQLPSKHRAWFVDPELAGGGALADHIVHLADIFRWYLGEEAVSVYAQSNRIFHGSEVRVETGGMVSLEFASGAFASIDCSWSRPEAWPSWGGLSFELVSARGAVRVDAFSQNVEFYSEDAKGLSWLPWGSDANAGMIGEFAQALAEGREPRPNGEDGLAAVRIVAAAYESAATGQPRKI